MNTRTVLFIKKKFQEHYKKDPPQSPPGLKQREWGFLMFEPSSGMRRHKGFLSDLEMQEYVQAMVPAHVYHSAAYYEHPAAGTMKEKKWQGADLIFDLDADHLPEPADSYKGMLDAVKLETLKLIDFLTDDFGFEKDALHIAFSGGRGYHIHVRDPNVLKLGSAPRREIVDFLSGTGLKINNFIIKERISGFKGGKMKDEITYILSQYGWGKRISKYFSDYLRDLAILGDNEIVEELKKYEIKRKKQRENIIKVIRNDETINKIEMGQIDIAHYSEKFFNHLMKKAIDQKKVSSLVGAQTDEPVTADIKRLIRAASSLHGKSGMKVISLTVDQLHDFEPLVDAVVFGKNEIKINVTRPTIIEMMDERFELDEGKHVLPEYAAIYLMCRGGAEYMEVTV